MASDKPVTNNLPRGVEYVVLTDSSGEAIGTAAKATVHSENTPSHRAFSSFLFDPVGKLIITQRAKTKKTWPGVWTNTCCGHPLLEETPAAAAERRARYELGMRVPAQTLTLMLPDFRYTVRRSGVVENEFCPVLVGVTSRMPVPNPAEVGGWMRVPWSQYAGIAIALKSHLPQGTPSTIEEYDKYRASFGSVARYDAAHSLSLGSRQLPLSEWSLWETLELVQNETFKEWYTTRFPHAPKKS